jgi:tripartite-type tricarboxylate transporter receptor subunit TctC
MVRFLSVVLMAAAGCIAAPGLAWAQDFPSKAIRFVQPFPPGGAVDTISRLVGERLSARIGQQVVVDNRPGANGGIAVNLLAVSLPDGYTIMAVAQSFLTHQSIYRDFKYDVRKDITPIVLGATFPLVLVVHPTVPARSVKELIDLAKAKSGGLSYGDNGGIGSSGHIAMELFKQQSGAEIIHVPYKGAGPMYVDLIGGQIQTAFTHITSTLPYVSAGRLRPLATTASTRLPVLPDVPTTAEAGFAGVNTTELWGVIGPAGMPAAVVKKLNSEIADIIKAPPMNDRLTGEGAQVVAASPEKFSEFIKVEVPKIAWVLQRAGIKPGNF